MKFKKSYFIYVIILLLIFINNVFWNLLFSEIMPNTDDDANLEYIELFNDSSDILFLSWYTLKDKSWKSFVFDNSYFLNPFEKKKYYRTETKILLNDIDEELFLYDKYWNQIDYFTYTTSDNWKEIVIINKSNNLSNAWTVAENLSWTIVTQTGTIEATQTWILDNVIIDESNSWSIETQTWVINETSSWTLNIDELTNTWVILISPVIDYNFQLPTYLLEKDEKVDTYNCDRTKTECKINLDIRNTFVWDFKENDFDCITDYWFITWEENKCNPNTIVVPVWKYDFKIEIKNKTNDSIYNKIIFKVINDWYLPPVANTYANSTTTIIQNNSSVINILKPEIKIQSWLDENYVCKNNDSCSINLIYEEKNSQERCVWDFWWWVYDDWTQLKCNPWYVKYANWLFTIKLKVYQNWNESNFMTNQMVINNEKIVKNEIINDELQKSVSNNNNLNTNIDNIIIVDNILDNNKVWFDYKNLKINNILVNPEWSDNSEYIEIINKWNDNIDLSNCWLDDIENGWSKYYNFEKNDILKSKQIKKYYKEITNINLNNSSDEVNLYCDWKIIDKLIWDYKIKDWEILNHTNLDTYKWAVKVIEVIDNQTLKVQFLNSKKQERLKFLWLESDVNEDLFEYLNDELDWEEIEVEFFPNLLKDDKNNLFWIVNKDWKNFNINLLENWYAKTDSNLDFKNKDDFLKAESVAKKNKLWIWASNQVVTKQINSKTQTGSIKLEAIISIQWKLSKNKVLSWNKITCLDTCSVNFDWSQSKWKIKKYSWDFWNGQKFEWKNPSTIKYTKYWEYKVYLAVLWENWELNIDEFLVNFYQTPKSKKSSSIITEVNSDFDDSQQNGSENEEINVDTDSNSKIFYVILAVIWLILVWLIFWKEKLF